MLFGFIKNETYFLYSKDATNLMKVIAIKKIKNDDYALLVFYLKQSSSGIESICSFMEGVKSFSLRGTKEEVLEILKNLKLKKKLRRDFV